MTFFLACKLKFKKRIVKRRATVKSTGEGRQPGIGADSVARQSELKLERLDRTERALEPPRANLVDLAYDAIKRAILENTYPPGYQAGELEVARQLSMSRTPVHEAMARLQEEGLVRILPKRGILVLGLTAADVADIYDVIIALEGAAAERLARLPDTARHAAADTLEAATGEMEAALRQGDRPAWAKADRAFHDALSHACGNPRLDRIVGTVADQLHRARMFTLGLRPLPTASAVDHGAIIAAVRAGDPVAASNAARAHRQKARDQFLPLLQELKLNNI